VSYGADTNVYMPPDNGPAPRTVPPPIRRALGDVAAAVVGWGKLRGLTQAQLADRAGINRKTVLREARGMSQAAVADELGTSRPNVSRIESEVDVRLSTLERYVEALGGRLKINAVFDDEAVKLS